MTLRTRIAVASGLAVLLTVVAVSIAVYLVVRTNLHRQIDESLEHHRQPELEHDPATLPDALPPVPNLLMALVDADGEPVATAPDRPAPPVTDEVLAVARGDREDAMFTTTLDGTTVRVLATAVEPDLALVVARPLTEVEKALRQLVITLTLISIGAIAAAAVIGRLVAAAAAAPVHRVADAAEAVARTGELSHHLDVPGGDDLGRLTDSFNAMLDALNTSLTQQRQLVADASHELRTPLTTVRTNVEVLARAEELDDAERATLIAETVAQIGELTRLVEDLVELARGDGEEEPFTVVDLEDLTRTVVQKIAASYPAITFGVTGDTSRIDGAPRRVARAISNLVDNAAKWSEPGGEVDIAIEDSGVSVRDRGPGIADDDLPHVFDRFYRSPEARSMTGSGLGLSIVKQVADSHGATVTATSAPDGGALFVLRFPSHTDV